MERLTKKFTDGSAYCEEIDDVGIKGVNYPTYVGKAVDKLAQFEDLEELIGIPLKDIAKIFYQNIPEDCKHPHKAIVLTDDDIDKWNGYKNAEEQGLLLRLPCKVGDTVYCIIGTPKRTPCYVEEDIFDLSKLHKMGKTVFLTRAEAEQRLKEMESE